LWPRLFALLDEDLESLILVNGELAAAHFERGVNTAVANN
jgi:hypothetical protein